MQPGAVPNTQLSVIEGRNQAEATVWYLACCCRCVQLRISTCWPFSGTNKQQCGWAGLPSELLIMVVTVLQQERWDLDDVKTFRLICKHWQVIASDAITTFRGDNIVDQDVTPQQVTNMFTQLHCLTAVYKLPCKNLPCLVSSPRTDLVTLTLTGTGSSILYATCLPQLTSLQHIILRGPVTLTETLLSVLGSLPQLHKRLFHNLLFPRTAYQQCCFHDVLFKVLDSLYIMNLPLDSNGEGSEVAGQQFLLSLPKLENLTVKTGTANRLLLDIVNKMPTVKTVTIAVPKAPREWQFTLHESVVEEWSQWSLTRGGQCQWVVV